MKRITHIADAFLAMAGASGMAGRKSVGPGPVARDWFEHGFAIGDFWKGASAADHLQAQ